MDMDEGIVEAFRQKVKDISLDKNTVDAYKQSRLQSIWKITFSTVCIEDIAISYINAVDVLQFCAAVGKNHQGAAEILLFLRKIRPTEQAIRDYVDTPDADKPLCFDALKIAVSKQQDVLVQVINWVAGQMHQETANSSASSDDDIVESLEMAHAED